MAANDSPLVGTLRQEIERKYREAIQALETLSGYLDTPASPASNATPATTQNVPVETSAGPATRVNVVLGALNAGGEYKTVEQLQSETGLPEEAVRAVLYSKYVKPKIASKKIGKKFGFRRKTVIQLPRQPKKPLLSAAPTIASAVRDLLASHPAGLTAKQISEGVSPELVASVANGKKAIGVALFKMKKKGRVAHDEETGVYRIIA